MRKSNININLWWPRNAYGDRVSVNSIFVEMEGTENEVGRYTLTKARNGELEKADIATLEALARICSKWAGKEVSIDDMVSSNQPKKGNFRRPIAA